MRLVLLGTGGGPRPSAARAPSAQAVVAGGRIVVIDCGNGVARQMAMAGLDPRDVSEVLLTHHHIDHSADLVMLPLLSWINGRVEPVTVYGPPPTSKAVDRLLAGYEEDLVKRTASTGRPDFRSQLWTADIDKPGTFIEAADVRVTATRVEHPPFETALAYRVDTADASVVISGDTRPSDDLVDLAAGADVLVHEAVHPSAIEQLERSTNASTIRAHMESCHTMLAQVGRIAEGARVGTLVLSHLVPHTGVAEEEWRREAQQGFSGRVIVGQDLMEVPLPGQR